MKHVVDLLHEFVIHVIHHVIGVHGRISVRHVACGAGKPTAPMLHNVKAFRVFGHHMGHFAVQLPAGHVVDDLRAVLQRHASHRCARSVDGQHRAFRNQRIHST